MLPLRGAAGSHVCNWQHWWQRGALFKKVKRLLFCTWRGFAPRGMGWDFNTRKIELLVGFFFSLPFLHMWGFMLSLWLSDVVCVLNRFAPRFKHDSNRFWSFIEVARLFTCCVFELFVCIWFVVVVRNWSTYSQPKEIHFSTCYVCPFLVCFQLRKIRERD